MELGRLLRINHEDLNRVERSADFFRSKPGLYGEELLSELAEDGQDYYVESIRRFAKEDHYNYGGLLYGVGHGIEIIPEGIRRLPPLPHRIIDETIIMVRNSLVVSQNILSYDFKWFGERVSVELLEWFEKKRLPTLPYGDRGDAFGGFALVVTGFTFSLNEGNGKQ